MHSLSDAKVNSSSLACIVCFMWWLHEMSYACRVLAVNCNFFLYPHFSGIAPCVGTTWKWYRCHTLAMPCLAALGLVWSWVKRQVVRLMLLLCDKILVYDKHPRAGCNTQSCIQYSVKQLCILSVLLCLFFKGAPCPNKLTINVSQNQNQSVNYHEVKNKQSIRLHLLDLRKKLLKLFFNFSRGGWI